MMDIFTPKIKRIAIAFAVVVLLGLPFVVCQYLAWNELLEQYSWIITVASLEVSVLSIAFSVLYHRWRPFFLFCHRVRSLVAREHTFWKPSFRFMLDDNQCDQNKFMQDILREIQSVCICNIQPEIRQITLSEGEVSFSDEMSFVLSYDNATLYMESKMKMLVPSYMNKTRATFLLKFAERIMSITDAISVQSDVRVFFEKNKNPYQGLFVCNIPGDLLQSFDACFFVDNLSTCEVTAKIDAINIGGQNLNEIFRALEDILSFRPLEAR